MPSARSDGVSLSSPKVTKRQEGQVNFSTCPLNAASLALAVSHLNSLNCM